MAEADARPEQDRCIAVDDMQREARQEKREPLNWSEVDRVTEPLLSPESGHDRTLLSGERRGKWQPNKRLASLDVFRGLTIAVMILVDDAGGSWPKINHSPWNGVTLADFAVPFFLFIVGVSLVMALKKVSEKWVISRKVVLRAIKLFLLGLILQGGYFHGLKDLSYGVDIEKIRVMGILQRIAFAFLVVAICEIFTAKSNTTDRVDGFVGLSKIYRWHWLAAFVLLSLYLGLLYGLYVPDWQFESPIATDVYNSSKVQMNLFTVNCSVRGDLGPACNAVGYVDRSILSLNHLYLNPVYKRTKDCSVKSPDYGDLPLDAPVWCLAPFDPEGLLSSLMAGVTCFIGAHYGHVLEHFKGHKRRLREWILSSFVLLLVGFLLNFLGMPLNKPLYTLSYTCVTAGAAGLVFSAFYILVDVFEWRYPFLWLEWMGMNALLIYALAACELFPAAVQGFYWRSPGNNLVNLIEKHVFASIIHPRRLAKLLYVLFEILFWCSVAGILKMNKIFWKI